MRPQTSTPCNVQVHPDVVAVKRGSEVVTELTLTTGSGEQVWQSRIVYLVMHRHRKAAKETPAGIGEKLENIDETVAWSLPENLGRVYGAGVQHYILWGSSFVLRGEPSALLMACKIIETAYTLHAQCPWT